MMFGRTRSPEIELSSDVSGNLNVLLTDSEDEGILSYQGLVQEEKLEEIMQEFYKEITYTTSCHTSPPLTVTLPSPSSSSSHSPPLSLSSSSLTFFPVSDVKISESCGASMSDSSSTVMAGIEFVGPTGKSPDLKRGLRETGNWSPEKEQWITGMSCDCDDQWLARVLRWGPLELEDWRTGAELKANIGSSLI